MGMTYTDLFSSNTFLGQWIRNLPTMISIHDVLITHAGVSGYFISYKLNPKITNRLFVNEILGKPWDLIRKDSILAFLAGSEGPLWYRGYFTDNRIPEDSVTTLLNYFGKDKIIIGHTSQDSLITLYNNKVFVVDSSIKLGKTGELLLFENGKYYRCRLNGEQIHIQ